MIGKEYLSQLNGTLRGAIDKAFEQTNTDLAKLRTRLTPEQLKQLDDSKITFQESLNALNHIKNSANDFNI